ncbi:uncharacterized protein DUF3352 [Bacteroides zoogleoformans]|uniref:DUF3352 domain-containing protein n=1 Tax=Bacteroides zoogleoformans TaxID=28119 RepID=A0ABN5ILV7_9BACE|nr:DUF3352 domain-containing protein [Bacteroides zoogleoformans]AVM53756.1 DUF3352 domain-containing protein [Bacteroides zoogleoformans]TWJ18169.1 uncharacterized protein DUF3352 [Bacteroides zoogleoformans]
MKLRLLIQIAVIVSVVLLCTGFAVYSFLRLHSVENQRDFDLYSLVPQDAIAILETNHMADLMEDINRLDCSKDNHFLYVSDLFSYLKENLHTLLQDTPHGLSMQMNKMLISFHEPDTPENQVLYCTLDADDYKLVEVFVQKYCSGSFPRKTFDYKGEEIRIYPMADGRFLAMYVTADFFVVSFQKRLVEQVIDAYRSKKSLTSLAAFHTIRTNRHNDVAAMVYVRMKAVEMGKKTDDIHSYMRLGSWVEFEVKLNENAIYCSGMSHGVDSTHTFMNVLRAQEPIEGFSGANLPITTFLYHRWAISNKSSFFNFVTGQAYAKVAYSDEVKQRDEEWTVFLNDFAAESFFSCLFRLKDTMNVAPCAVACIPVKDEQLAERRLQSLLYTTPQDKESSSAFKSFDYTLYPKAIKYKKYALPRNSLLAQMTGIAKSDSHTYACFYRSCLLLAPDVLSLSAYIDGIENGEVLDGTSVYEESIGSLSPVYNFVMMADMEKILQQPEVYVRLMPNFFFRQADFFRHFMLVVQFTCVDKVVYPNIVLLYKGGR